MLPAAAISTPLDRRGSFEVDPKYLFARIHGGGYRGIYDLGDPDNSRFIIANGQSGHFLSRDYDDLVPLWNDVESFSLSGSQQQLEVDGLAARVDFAADDRILG